MIGGALLFLIIVIAVVVGLIVKLTGGQEQLTALDNGDYRYELVPLCVQEDQGGWNVWVSKYALFDKQTGQLNYAQDIYVTPHYETTANPKGGCFIVDQTSGNTWVLDAKGNLHFDQYPGTDHVATLIPRSSP